jgi:hypothetical protein
MNNEQKLVKALRDQSLRDQINHLIRLYENRLVDKKRRLEENQNDYLEGIVLQLEQVIEDLKKIN